MGKPSYQSIEKYNKKAYDRINIVVPKGRKEDITNHIRSNGETINGLINKFLQTELGMSQDEWKRKEKIG